MTDFSGAFKGIFPPIPGDAANCQCRMCAQERFRQQVDAAIMAVSRMYLCSECGNKRCPHATDHRNKCSGSNLPGQTGSDYE